MVHRLLRRGRSPTRSWSYFGLTREGGVIVQPAANAKDATKLARRSTAIAETSDGQLIDATLRLKTDPQLESSGLPQTR